MLRSSNVLLTTLALACMCGGAVADTASHFWSMAAGDASDQHLCAVVTDAAGNVYAAGYFEGTVNFGGGNLTSAGLSDIFLVKFDAAGTHQWSQRFGGASSSQALAIAISPAGQVWIGGWLNGSVDFGGGVLASVGGDDVFLASFSSSGAHEFSQRFGDAGSQQCRALAVDASGNVCITGFFAGSVDFGGGALVCAGTTDIFVARFNGSGAHQWSQRFGDGTVGGVPPQVGESIAADAAGNVYLGGDFSGTVNFGGGNLVCTGANDVFLAKFDASGVHQWSQRFGNSQFQECAQVCIDVSGDLYIVGEFGGSVDFGGGVLTCAGFFDAYIAKFNAAGVHQWSKRFGGPDLDRGFAVATDALRRVYLAGFYFGPVDFGGGALEGPYGAFLAAFDPDGSHRWSDGLGGATIPFELSIDVHESGFIALTGTFQGSVNLGGDTFASAGMYDVFLAQLGTNPAEAVIQSITDIANDNGRQVRIVFNRSGFDGPFSPLTIEDYEVYRRVDALPAAADAPAAPNERIELASQLWDLVATGAAHGVEQYSMIVPTLADSTVADGIHHSVFLVRSASDAPLEFVDSEPDSGYSVDNLAPTSPTSLAYSAGVLSWAVSTDPGFDYFTVYGSTVSSFASATVIDYTEAPVLDVSATPRPFFFVTATDVAGNEGVPAVFVTNTDVGDAPGKYVLSVSAFPNPFNPSTTVRYTVPSAGRVTLVVYDIRGGRVATLVDRRMDAGAFSTEWNGRDGNGAAVSSGIYFVRVSRGGNARSYKVTLLK